MEPGEYFIYNGEILKTGKPIFDIDNRSFRYGDGCFETMKLLNGNIVLSHYHFERLFSSLNTLKLKSASYLTHSYLAEQIKNLAAKNNHSHLARIRLTVFRIDDDLLENKDYSLNYIIQSWQLDEEILKFNKAGLITGLYKDAKKSCDNFSHIKSNNYLPYVMAAIWAKENKLDEGFLLNNFNRVSDASIANIFIVKDGKIKTPALNEGCIAGIMRRHLIKCIKEESIPFEETLIKPEELLEAHEIFLTNAIRGIRWVKQFEKNNYSNELAKYLHKKFV
jgi:branched-subunit amino acid aminotransferase/4-amino-4-deoxychorismate lyase